MYWDAIGATGEIIGASGVVLSLVYLAVQLRTQNWIKRACKTSCNKANDVFLLWPIVDSLQ
jgi:hypothetical protein